MADQVPEKKAPKGPKKLERHFKGVANHRRIQILLYVASNPDAILDELTKRIKCDFRTASVHAQKLVQAGLIEKQYKGRAVLHNLTPYGQTFVKFIGEFSKL